MEWTEIAGAVVATVIAVLGVAKLWVKFTPSTKDDEIVAKIDEVVKDLSGKE